MLRIAHLIRHRALLLALLVPALGGCESAVTAGLEEQEQPSYQLAAAGQAWTAPYRVGEEWRFRNAQGYVRRYQVKGLVDRSLPGLPAKGFRAQYYRQEISARLERVDSAYAQRAGQQRFTATFTISAAVPNETPPTAQLAWGTTTLNLPVAEAVQPSAIRFSDLHAQPGRPLPPWAVTQVIYSQEKGVVRFVEASGAVWVRD